MSTRDGPLAALAKCGQGIWIDELSRRMIDEGDLGRFVAEGHVTGVTSNPSTFKAALAEGDAYDQALWELPPDIDAKGAFWTFACQDVRRACDVLRPIYDRRHAGADGLVSIEVDPNLAHNPEATLREALRLRDEIDRPNLLVKIPATAAGLEAIEDAIAAGCSVNVTLIFALGRYTEVATAYLRGLERLLADGGDPSSVHSVASFFVSRVDTETDRRLDEAGGLDHLRGRLGIANAKLAYRRYHELFAGSRWARLAAAGARPQRCLWASTSTKNPAYRDTMYVEELIGPDTVTTMPRETLNAFADHGRVRRTLDRDVAEAVAVFTALADAGIDDADITATLEREGIEKFARAYEDLLSGIDARRRSLDREGQVTSS